MLRYHEAKGWSADTHSQILCNHDLVNLVPIKKLFDFEVDSDWVQDHLLRCIKSEMKNGCKLCNNVDLHQVVLPLSACLQHLKNAFVQNKIMNPLLVSFVLDMLKHGIMMPNNESR